VLFVGSAFVAGLAIGGVAVRQLDRDDTAALPASARLSSSTTSPVGQPTSTTLPVGAARSTPPSAPPATSTSEPIAGPLDASPRADQLRMSSSLAVLGDSVFAAFDTDRYFPGYLPINRSPE
jgi:hypothetical protein